MYGKGLGFLLKGSIRITVRGTIGFSIGCTISHTEGLGPVTGLLQRNP